MSGNDETFLGLKGHLTTDYFEFYCRKCGTKVEDIVFHSIDTVSVKVFAKCIICDFTYIFKIRTRPQLGPIEPAKVLGRLTYKLFDRRRLPTVLRELGHPRYKKP